MIENLISPLRFLSFARWRLQKGHSASRPQQKQSRIQLEAHFYNTLRRRKAFEQVKIERTPPGLRTTHTLTIVRPEKRFSALSSLFSLRYSVRGLPALNLRRNFQGTCLSRRPTSVLMLCSRFCQPRAPLVVTSSFMSKQVLIASRSNPKTRLRFRTSRLGALRVRNQKEYICTVVSSTIPALVRMSTLAILMMPFPMMTTCR